MVGPLLTQTCPFCAFPIGLVSFRACCTQLILPGDNSSIAFAYEKAYADTVDTICEKYLLVVLNVVIISGIRDRARDQLGDNLYRLLARQIGDLLRLRRHLLSSANPWPSCETRLVILLSLHKPPLCCQTD